MGSKAKKLVVECQRENIPDNSSITLNLTIDETRKLIEDLDALAEDEKSKKVSVTFHFTTFANITLSR